MWWTDEERLFVEDRTVEGTEEECCWSEGVVVCLEARRVEGVQSHSYTLT
jgi:hypothetical protein